MKPPGLFWMWAGAIWNVELVVYGALIMSFGLSYLQAVSAILVGNLAYLFLGWASLPGPETGTNTFMVSCAPFGRNGTRVPSLFDWLTQVGFETDGIVLIVVTVYSHEGVHVSDTGKAVIIILAVAVQFVVPFLGHATITRVLRYLSYVSTVVFAIMAAPVIPHAHLSHLHLAKGFTDSWWLWTTGIVVIVSAGGLGWTENAADYSRYLPPNTPKGKTIWAAAWAG